MQSAILTIRGETADLEFRVVAFDDGSVSAWRVQDGHLIGKSIEYAAVRQDPIKQAVQQLVCKYPHRRTELTFDR